jgi:hypothetical protein
VFRDIRGDLRVKRNIDVENELHVKESLLLGTETAPEESHVIYSESQKPSQLNGKLKLNKSSDPQYTFKGDEDTGISSDSANKLSLVTKGEERLVVTEDGKIYGKNLHTTDKSSVSDKEKQFIASGTYTPILLLIENIDDATVYECHFTRIGNVVSVSGRIDIDVSSAYTSYELNLSLPIPSTLDGPGSLSGIAKATSDATTCIAICPDTIDDEARFIWSGQSTVSNKEYYFNFTYLIT